MVFLIQRRRNTPHAPLQKKKGHPNCSCWNEKWKEVLCPDNDVVMSNQRRTASFVENWRTGTGRMLQTLGILIFYLKFCKLCTLLSFGKLENFVVLNSQHTERGRYFWVVSCNIIFTDWRFKNQTKGWRSEKSSFKKVKMFSPLFILSEIQIKLKFYALANNSTPT